MKKYMLPIISVFTLIPALFAQTTYELFLIERNYFQRQTSATIFQDLETENPYAIIAAFDFDTSGANPTGAFTAEGNGQILNFDDFDLEEGNVEGEASFATLSELNTTIPAGTYSIKRNGTILSEITIGATALPTPNPIKEYNQLQNLDPTQPITLTWDAYPAAGIQNVLEIGAGYWDEGLQQFVDLDWFPNTRSQDPSVNPFEIEGLEPTATSVTVPANTFVGSPNGRYDISVYYAEVKGTSDSVQTPDATNAWLESTEFEISVVVDTTGSSTWATYEIDANGNVDTQGWLGTLSVIEADLNWIYSFDLSGWLYIDEVNVTAEGSWTYIPR